MKSEVIINDVVIHGEKITSEQHLALHMALEHFLASVPETPPDTDDEDELFAYEFNNANRLCVKELRDKILSKTETFSL